ncbi:MAG: hypothetical protein RBR52_15275 [Thiomonas sp.]|uniref:hypothetical protein n=1 Tax=Thiomonas sp. TaxID=2047785 RepID=UPI002A363186|nr:hypothetical protein [Thiomonas sp.]MDY0331838.1 hypothetical protein [Thiomonas sp.]
MIELLGMLFGGVFRILPELLKWADRKDERKHELSMLDKNLEADRMRAQMEIQRINAEADVILGQKEIEAIVAATKAQGARTGVRWVDGINALMRPIITFWWVIILYTAAMSVQFYGLLQHDFSVAAALLTVFGQPEKAIAASIISFWFVDRSLRRPSVLR